MAHRGADAGSRFRAHAPRLPDLGSGVDRAFGAGNREYDWAWSIGPEAVPAMIAALGGDDGDDPLLLLKAWHDASGSMDPGSHLRKAGVPVEFWSRVGD